MENKPLASLCVFFYNQVLFVEDTIKGALSQTYDNLEIVLSDDCSTDGTFEKIQNTINGYRGPHKIIVNENGHNLGLVPHVNKILYEKCHGDYIFINGGDDVSMPNRVSIGINYFINNPQITAVTFSHFVIDKFGKITDEHKFTKDSLLSIDDASYLYSPYFMTDGCALSISRDELTKYGPMSDDCQTEDSVLRFRAILLGFTMRSAYMGLKYRVHENNISKRIYRLKTEYIAQQYERDLNKVKDLLQPELYKIVVAKIVLYIKYRNLNAELSNSGFLHRMYIKLKQYFLISGYRKNIQKYI